MSLGIVSGALNVFLCRLLPKAKGNVAGDRDARRERHPVRWWRSVSAATPGSTRDINAINGDLARFHIIGAIDQFGHRTFARTCLPDHRDRLPRRGVEGNIVEDHSIAVRKTYMVKDNIATHRLGIALWILVQLALFAHQ